jgi:hypothetical protein
MYKNKQYLEGIDRAKKYAIRSIRRNDLNSMNAAFEEIVEMCIQLKNLEMALKIKNELCHHFKS